MVAGGIKLGEHPSDLTAVPLGEDGGVLIFSFVSLDGPSLTFAEISLNKRCNPPSTIGRKSFYDFLTGLR